MTAQQIYLALVVGTFGSFAAVLFAGWVWTNLKKA